MARQMNTGKIGKLSILILQSMLLFQVLVGGFSGWERTAYGEESTPTPTMTLTPTPTPTFWPTPIAPNAEYVGGNTLHFYGSDINYRDEERGAFHKIGNSIDEKTTFNDLKGKKDYKFDKRSIKSSVVADTTDEFVKLKFDKDYPYTEQEITFTLDKIKWSGKNVKTSITPDYAVSGVVFTASEVAVQSEQNFTCIFRMLS